jgi:hypothetical protein
MISFSIYKRELIYKNTKSTIKIVKKKQIWQEIYPPSVSVNGFYRFDFYTKIKLLLMGLASKVLWCANYKVRGVSSMILPKIAS